MVRYLVWADVVVMAWNISELYAAAASLQFMGGVYYIAWYIISWHLEYTST